MLSDELEEFTTRQQQYTQNNLGALSRSRPQNVYLTSSAEPIYNGPSSSTAASWMFSFLQEAAENTMGGKSISECRTKKKFKIIHDFSFF